MRSSFSHDFGCHLILSLPFKHPAQALVWREKVASKGVRLFLSWIL